MLGSGTNPAGNGTTGTIAINPDGTIAIGTGTGTAAAGSLSGQEIQTALASLDPTDVAALKLKCRDVLGNPGAFSAATVAVCKALAGR